MTFINIKTNGQFPGRKKRETNGIRPMRTEMSETTIHYWVYIVLIFLTFSLICYITWVFGGLSFFLKIGFSIGGRALSFALVKCGLSGGLAWAIGCVLRALFSAEEMPLWMFPSGADAGSEASVNQVPNRSEAGPSHPGPRESNSPRNSFPSVPSDLSPLPAGSVPSVPSLPSLGGDVEVEQPAPIQPQNERNEPQSPAHQDPAPCKDPALIFQHDTIKHRISTVTPQRDVNDDEIDTIISLKRGIISRMAQLAILDSAKRQLGRSRNLK